MKNKLFQNKLFQNARLNLTTYYVLIMSIILVTFSGVLIYTIEINLEENFNDKIITTGSIEDPVVHVSNDIKKLIYYINGLLIIIITILSYFLAGKTLRPIKDSLDAQKKFSEDASHDLRTPISIIISESEVALSGKNDKDLRYVVQSNLEEAKKMSILVNDLLLIYQSENKDINKNMVLVNIHYFISRIISKLKIKAEDKGLTLTINNYEKIILKVDVANFERAISNIIENSIFYTKSGGIHVKVTGDERYVYIIISDTGVGIEEKDLPFIFDRFYRSERFKNNESGSGLGLSIAKQIIDKHKGSIEVESKVNEGTKVKISMPKN